MQHICQRQIRQTSIQRQCGSQTVRIMTTWRVADTAGRKGATVLWR